MGGTQRWFGNVMWMNEDDFVMRMCEARIKGEGVRGYYQ